jgi:hypothetical protein
LSCPQAPALLGRRQPAARVVPCVRRSAAWRQSCAIAGRLQLLRRLAVDRCRPTADRSCSCSRGSELGDEGSREIRGQMVPPLPRLPGAGPARHTRGVPQASRRDPASAFEPGCWPSRPAAATLASARGPYPRRIAPRTIPHGWDQCRGLQPLGPRPLRARPSLRHDAQAARSLLRAGLPSVPAREDSPSGPGAPPTPRSCRSPPSASPSR